MPIYEYLCAACGARFERLLRRMADQEQPAPSCPECGSEDTQRVISTFARHGPPGVDREAVQAERSAAQRLASITPKEQITKWRTKPKNKT